MPHRTQGKRQNGSVFLWHAFINDGAQPSVRAAIPIVDCIADIRCKLKATREQMFPSYTTVKPQIAHNVLTSKPNTFILEMRSQLALPSLS